MVEGTSGSSEYIHGNSREERRRLTSLNEILNDACLKELNPKPGECVLDLGSGLGQFTRKIAETVGKQSKVIGIERDENQLNQARKLAGDADEADLVEFRQGDATAVPLQSFEWGSFDLVHARFLLEHVSCPAKVVDQMARSVRAGGRVFICDDDHQEFRPWPEPPGFQSIWRAYVGTFTANGCDPYIGRKLVLLLAESGLTPVRNGSIFFGGCSGDDKFEATAENLIQAFKGAKAAMLSGGQLDETAYDAAMEGLVEWKAGTSSALWYSAYFAEGVAPS